MFLILKNRHYLEITYNAIYLNDCFSIIPELFEHFFPTQFSNFYPSMDHCTRTFVKRLANDCVAIGKRGFETILYFPKRTEMCARSIRAQNSVRANCSERKFHDKTHGNHTPCSSRVER